MLRFIEEGTPLAVAHLDNAQAALTARRYEDVEAVVQEAQQLGNVATTVRAQLDYTAGLAALRQGLVAEDVNLVSACAAYGGIYSAASWFKTGRRRILGDVVDGAPYVRRLSNKRRVRRELFRVAAQGYAYEARASDAIQAFERRQFPKLHIDAQSPLAYELADYYARLGDDPVLTFDNAIRATVRAVANRQPELHRKWHTRAVLAMARTALTSPKRIQPIREVMVRFEDALHDPAAARAVPLDPLLA